MASQPRHNWINFYLVMLVFVFAETAITFSGGGAATMPLHQKLEEVLLIGVTLVLYLTTVFGAKPIIPKQAQYAQIAFFVLTVALLIILGIAYAPN